MLDTTIVESCAQCVIGAATHDGSDADLTLSATALARDLRDTQCDGATGLLDAACRLAIARLDCSDLDARSFATTLRRLASLRDRTRTALGARDHHWCAPSRVDRCARLSALAAPARLVEGTSSRSRPESSASS